MSMTQHEGGSVPEWSLGDRMAKARKAAGLSTEAMADHLDVHRKTIGNYEHDRTLPARATLIAWSWACKVPLTWLVTGDAEHGPDVGPGLGVEPTAEEGRLYDLDARRSRNADPASKAA